MEPEKKIPSFLEVTKKLSCQKHDEPFIFVCVETNCADKERLFCMECNDQSQLGKATHRMISLKKFNTLYTQYGTLFKAQNKHQIHERIEALRENLNNKLSELQLLLTPFQNQLFLEGEQEQIVRGKIGNLLNKNIWSELLEMQAKQCSQQEIRRRIVEKSKVNNESCVEKLDKLEANLNQSFKDVISYYKKLSFQEKNQNTFSEQNKNKNLVLSEDKKSVRNSTEYGHYFCLTSQDFDVQNFSYRFLLQKVSSNVSYWFGFIFPVLADKTKWTNTYDEGKGGFFIVIFDGGKKINFWDHERKGIKAEQIDGFNIKDGNVIELSINFQKKILNFVSIFQGKKQQIKAVKPHKWFGKIFPAVGFYGKDGIIKIN